MDRNEKFEQMQIRYGKKIFDVIENVKKRKTESDYSQDFYEKLLINNLIVFGINCFDEGVKDNEERSYRIKKDVINTVIDALGVE